MENTGKQMEHLDQAPALTPTVTTPQCGHIVWEKNTWYSEWKSRLQPTKFGGLTRVQIPVPMNQTQPLGP